MTDLIPSDVSDSYVAELQPVPLEENESLMTLEKENPSANTIYLEALGKDISLISVAVDAPQDVISAMSGRIGNLDGITAKAVYSKLPEEKS